MTLRHRLAPALAFSLVFVAGAVAAQNRTVAGELTIEPPTLISLGFDWTIAGDDNRMARVDVTFRKKGEQEWRQALQLMRLQQERVYGPPNRAGVPSPFSYTAPNSKHMTWVEPSRPSGRAHAISTSPTTCSSAGTIRTSCSAGTLPSGGNSPGCPATVESEYAGKVYAQGHVVADNYLADWHDGIDVATYAGSRRGC